MSDLRTRIAAAISRADGEMIEPDFWDYRLADAVISELKERTMYISANLHRPPIKDVVSIPDTKAVTVQLGSATEYNYVNLFFTSTEELGEWIAELESRRISLTQM
jgi:hypothetical protein